MFNLRDLLSVRRCLTSVSESVSAVGWPPTRVLPFDVDALTLDLTERTDLRERRGILDFF